MSKRRAAALGAAVALAAAIAVTGSVSQMRAALAAPYEPAVLVTSRMIGSGRSQQGEVLVGGRVVMRVRTSSGGLTPAERASMTARRIDDLLRSGRLTPQSLRVGQANGEWVVLAGSEIIATASSYEASANGVSPQRLATIWRDNLAGALSAAQVAGYRGEAVERTSSKLVPIVAIGSGIHVGAAQIAGPASRVREAGVVGQLDATFQRVARIRIFIPLRGITSFSRVPEVNVNAYGDIRL